MENLCRGWGLLIPGKSASESLFWNLHQEVGLKVWRRHLLIGPGPSMSTHSHRRPGASAPHASPTWRKCWPVQRENRKPRGPGTKNARLKEITHVSKKQTTAKAFRASWAVYLHILVCLLIKIVLGNFISQRLGHLFQLIITGIRTLSADLAMTLHRKGCLW